MTGFRKRLAQALIATVVLCALGFMICGSFSSPGNDWERVCMFLVFVMLASMISAVVLVAATYATLRLEVAKHLRRSPLSDEEFALRMTESKTVDLEFVHEVREMASRRFRRIGGRMFYPDDRLEEDLHLFDLSPFGIEDFSAEMEQWLGLEEDEIRARMGTLEARTFGELIATASALANRVKVTSHVANSEVPRAVWDRTLDG
jgi:hypothetical protein